MSEKCKTVFNLVVSCIGMLLGICAFITFFCVYKNMHAGVWGLISATLAAVCFHMHLLNFKERLDSWHSVDTLQGITLLGVMGLVLGGAGMTWYIFSAVYGHIPVLPVASSAVISAVWAFMTAKWGLLLIVNSRIYIGNFERDNPRLIQL